MNWIRLPLELPRRKLKSQQIESSRGDNDPIGHLLKRPVLHSSLTSNSLQDGITELQSILVHQGYLSESSGRFDAATAKAVKDFQTDQHLKVDGIVGLLTWVCLLYPGLSLKANTCQLHQATAVKQLQQILYQEGFLKDPPNGDFDRATEKAVKRFQRAYGLKVDGIVSALTWATVLGMRQGPSDRRLRNWYPLPESPSVLGDQLLAVGFIVLGIYHSPVPGAVPIFPTALVTAYGLTYVLPFVLEKLSVRRTPTSSQLLLQYAPYVLTGMFWKPILNMLVTLFK